MRGKKATDLERDDESDFLMGSSFHVADSTSKIAQSLRRG